MKKSALYRPYLPLIRWNERLWKSVAWLVILCFSVNCLTPAVVAAKTLARDAKLYAPPVKTEFDLASDALITLEDTLDRMNRRLNGQFEFAWQETLAQKSHATAPAAASRTQVQTLETGLTTALSTLDAQQPAIQTFFTQAQAQLKTQNVAAAMQTRAQTQGSQYAQMYATLKTKLAAITSATTDAAYQAAVADATTFLQTHSSKPRRAKFDPNHLAFGPSKERARQALTDAASIQQALQLPDAKGLVTTGVNGKTKAAAQLFARIPAMMPVKKADKAKVTAAEVVAKATPKDLPSNLAPNEDVQITPAIQAQATALGNNPLRIYQFVRNGVEYMPTYGSIQGSDYTMQTMRGNDIDQASLLIALLRASNIPAHYVYGTIRVPIDQIENWVGGVTDPHAALDLMGQGGIPTLGLSQGGVIKFAQIEHVWVEAQIAFAPSRGAVTTAGTTWVPMDPSFKQYAYTQGMNLQTAVPFDAAGFADHIQQTSTSNPTEGWVQNVDQNYIDSQVANYEAQLANYAGTTNPTAVVGDVIGAKSINQESLPMLTGSLPYAVTVIASRLDSLTDPLRWAFHYQVDGQTLLSESLPNLAGHLLALSFSPATAQDEQTLKSYIPSNVTDPNQLPENLPAGVVQLVSQFVIDGQAVKTGPKYGLGDSMTITKGLYQPNIGWQDGDKTITAGDYQAIGLIGAGLSQSQVLALQTQLQTTQTKLQAQQYSGLTAHDLTGAFLQGLALTYFSQTSAASQVGARAKGLVFYQLPSFGSISTASTVRYFFGIPRTFTPDGLLADVDRIAASAIEKNNDQAAWVSFNRAAGSMDSASEGNVFEELHKNDASQPQAISAVRLLSIANQQNQKIYTITTSNASAAISQINIDNSVKVEIADAINSGKIVSVHQSPVTYAGQIASGFVVSDSTTGAAAYKINTGTDGAKFIEDHPFLTTFGVFIIGLFLPTLALILSLLILAVSLITLIDSLDGGPCDAPFLALWTLLAVLFVVAGVVTGGAAAFAIVIYAFIADQAITTTVNNWPSCKVG